MKRVVALLLPLLVACSGANLLLSEQQLQIVLIGSSDSERKEYIEAANMTVAKFFRTHFFTDVSLPACEVCFEQKHFKPGTTYRGAWATEIWSRNDKKWWCAQNRPIQVLHRLLPVLQLTNSLPEYLFVGDDDTWINPTRLVEQFKKLDPNRDGFIGYAHPHHQYPWGGAGYFVHKWILLALLNKPNSTDARARVEASTTMHEMMVNAHIATHTPEAVSEKTVLNSIYGPDLMQRQMQKLGLAGSAPAPAAKATAGSRRLLLAATTTPAAAAAALPQQAQPNWLDICLQLKVGGRWCLWHSDWVIAECIYLAAGTRPDVGGERMGLSYNSCRPDTLQHFLTCHHVPAAHYKALYAHMLANDEGLRRLTQDSSVLVVNG